jgi:hypothetical protein
MCVYIHLDLPYHPVVDEKMSTTRCRSAPSEYIHTYSSPQYENLIVEFMNDSSISESSVSESSISESSISESSISESSINESSINESSINED